MTLAVAALSGLAGAVLGALAVVIAGRAQRRAERAIRLADAIAGLSASVGSLQQRFVTFRSVHRRLGLWLLRGPSPADAWQLVNDSQLVLAKAIEEHTKVVIFSTTQECIDGARGARLGGACEPVTHSARTRQERGRRRPLAPAAYVTLRLKVQARAAWPEQRRWILFKPQRLRSGHPVAMKYSPSRSAAARSPSLVACAYTPNVRRGSE